jgi:hypothetical protein
MVTIFQSARLKLTGWYLLIIMTVSIVFSTVIYALINQDYSRIEEAQRVRIEREQALENIFPGISEYRRARMGGTDLQEINDARTRLLTILGLANLGILGASSLAGYFLAGRTLRPIQGMVDEQSRFISDASHELRRGQ